MSKNYFNLRLTAATTSLYEYLTNTCLSHGSYSYLNPVKVGPFIHGWTDNKYDIKGTDVAAIDESLPIIDDSYDAIKWSVPHKDWINYDSRISKPQLLYIEIVNLNPFGKNGNNYDQPMTKSDWNKYFNQDGGNGYSVSPNGRLYLTPDEDDITSISVLISDSSKNKGIYAGFNIVFLLEVKGKNYCCIIDPVLNVRKGD